MIKVEGIFITEREFCLIMSTVSEKRNRVVVLFLPRSRHSNFEFQFFGSSKKTTLVSLLRDEVARVNGLRVRSFDRFPYHRI